MKKIIPFFLGLVVSLSLFAQQINKNLVLIEYFTETGCYYCPGAQLAGDDFVNGGYPVAVIGYHYGDDFSNSHTDARFNYYGISGTPTAEFNGAYEKVGGDHSNSVFSYWLPSYNNAADDLTSFSMSMTFESTNDIDFTAHITAKKVANYSNNNLKIRLVVVESHIPYSWQGLNVINYAVRDMYPNQNGVPVDFSSTDSVTVDIDFSLDPSWNLDNCALVAFLQDDNTKEVLQTVQDSLELPVGQVNLMLSKILSPEDTVTCGNTIAPSILVKNKGEEDINSFTVEYWINDQDHHTYEWTGSLPSLSTTTIDLPAIDFTLEDVDTLYINLINPNGGDDDVPDNNFGTFVFNKPHEEASPVYLSMNTGSWGFEISYLLINSAGDTIKSYQSPAGPLIVKDTFDLPLDECYTFYLMDAYGNGFNSDDGYLLLYTAVDTIMYVTGNFGDVAWDMFIPTQYINPTSVSYQKNIPSIYPNPASSYVFINSDYDDYSIQIFSEDGKLVKIINNCSGNERLDVNDLLSGVYTIKLINKDHTKVYKFIKQ